MCKYLLLLAFVAYASAATVTSNSTLVDETLAETKLQTSDVRADGFESALETSNSIHSVQTGDVKGNIQGEFSWVSPEGKVIRVTYVANELGYQPQSNVLPTSPPIPQEILKSLGYLKSHAQKEEEEKKN